MPTTNRLDQTELDTFIQMHEESFVEEEVLVTPTWKQTSLKIGVMLIGAGFSAAMGHIVADKCINFSAVPYYIKPGIDLFSGIFGYGVTYLLLGRNRVSRSDIIN